MFEIKLKKINKYKISSFIKKLSAISKFKDLKIDTVSSLWNNYGEIITKEPLNK